MLEKEEVCCVRAGRRKGGGRVVDERVEAVVRTLERSVR